MSRRARQTKTPNRFRTRISTAPRRSVWNIDSQPIPHLNSIRAPDNQIYRHVFTTDQGTVLTTSITVPTSAGLNFTLSNCPNASTLVALFDQYRIARIEAWVQPQQSNNGGHSGMLYSAVDYDSSTAISVSGLAQYSNVIIAPIVTTGHYHSFVPHVALAAYNGSFGGFENATAPWLDTNSTTIQHYGLLLACGTTIDVITVDLQLRYHLEFRNTV